MEKTYIVLYTYDARGNGRYRAYALQAPFKMHAEYFLDDKLRIEVADEAGKDAIFIMLKIQSKFEFIYGHTISVDDRDQSAWILQNLEKLIEEKYDEIKTCLVNQVSYDNERKNWIPPTDPFL